MILRQPVAVGLYEVVHKAADLIDGQFAPGMGVQHGGLIDVLLLPGESGIYGELVHLDLPPIQRGELIGKRPHVAGGEMTLVYHTGDFHTGIEGQVVNKPSIENVTSKSKGSAGLQCLDDAGGVLAAPCVGQVLIVDQMLGLLLPPRNLIAATAGVLIQRDVKAVDKLRMVLFDEPGVIFAAVLAGFCDEVAELLHDFEANHIMMIIRSKLLGH
jgi:hypothetical protein